jgi:hypothetical protein
VGRAARCLQGMIPVADRATVRRPVVSGLAPATPQRIDPHEEESYDFSICTEPRRRKLCPGTGRWRRRERAGSSGRFIRHRRSRHGRSRHRRSIGDKSRFYLSRGARKLGRGARQTEQAPGLGNQPRHAGQPTGFRHDSWCAGRTPRLGHVARSAGDATGHQSRRAIRSRHTPEPWRARKHAAALIAAADQTRTRGSTRRRASRDRIKGKFLRSRSRCAWVVVFLPFA